MFFPAIGHPILSGIMSSLQCLPFSGYSKGAKESLTFHKKDLPVRVLRCEKHKHTQVCTHSHPVCAVTFCFLSYSLILLCF